MTLNKDTDLLLIIDPQNDFCVGTDEFDVGALAVAGADSEFMSRIAMFSKKFDHIVISQDWHPKNHSSFASHYLNGVPFTQIEKPYGEDTLWPDHCIQTYWGAEFHPMIQQEVVPRAAAIIRKGMNPDIDSYSAFYENDRKTPTGLAGYVKERGIKRIFLVGLAFDYCVAYSAIDVRKSPTLMDDKMVPQVASVVVQDLTRAINPDTSETIDRLLLAGVQICGSQMV